MMVKKLVVAPIQYPFAAIVGACVMGLAMLMVPLVAHTLEPLLLPVNTDWKVVKAVREGDDLVLVGTMRKHRACVFLPPTIARDDKGQNYRLIHQSPNAGTSWAPDSDAQKFGPWRIINGAGKKLEFINVFQCHSLWPTFSELGEFDARGI